jgi:hypothetical protein
VFTVDALVNGVRGREGRTGFAPPPGVSSFNLQGQQTPAHRAL